MSRLRRDLPHEATTIYYGVNIFHRGIPSDRLVSEQACMQSQMSHPKKTHTARQHDDETGDWLMGASRGQTHTAPATRAHAAEDDSGINLDHRGGGDDAHSTSGARKGSNDGDNDA